MFRARFVGSTGRRRPPGRHCARRLAILGLSLELGFGCAPALAQQSAVAGTIRDAESLQPVAGAQVFVAGTVIGTLSNAQGAYRLEGVPSGSVTVTVRLIGYKEASQDVAVTTGQVATLDFQVEQTALRVQEIVVTGVVGETPRVKLPFTVERIDPQDIPVPASDVTALLAGKAAGTTVMRTTGQPGQTSAVLLRGPTSLDARGRGQSPLIVIDGVIQSESATLADVGTLDIDHIEIVKGAAAASLYGSRAQAGVIQIVTKRGTALQAGRTNVLLRTEFGVSELLGDLPFSRNHAFKMNEAGTAFIDPEGNEFVYDPSRDTFNDVNFDLNGDSPDNSFADGEWPIPAIDQLAQFYKPGRTVSVHGALSGRAPDWSYRVSGEWFRETGIVDCGEACRNPVALENFGDDYAVRDDGLERWNTRFAVDGRLGTLDLAATAFFSRSSQDDAAVQGGTFAGLLNSSPYIDYTVPDAEGRPRFDTDCYFGSFLHQLSRTDARNERRRVSGALDLTLPVTEWLSLEGNASYDRTDFLGSGFQSTSLMCDGNEWAGSISKQNFTDEAVNASLTASLAQSFLDGDLVTRAKLRLLGESQSLAANGAEGSRLSVERVPTFDAIEGAITANNEIRDIRALGYFAILGADYKGRYIVDGLVRRDGSSLFGPAERWHTYLRGSAAWRISQEPFWAVDWIDELKLRFSIGTAGGRPNFVAQYETLEVAGGGLLVPATIGNSRLKPELSVEREAGVNLVLFENLGLDVTYAWATTDDQILLVPKATVTGFSSQWDNAGEIKSNTWEASLRWSPLDEQDTGLSFRLNWHRTRSRITRFDLPEFSAARFRFAEGEPIGSLWGARFSESCLDVARSLRRFSTEGLDCSQFQVNDEGYMVWVGEGNDWTDGIAKGLWGTRGEVDGETFNWGMPIQTREQSRTCLRRHPGDRDVGEECALTRDIPVGNTQPDFIASFASNFRYKGLAVSALFDGTLGFDLINVTLFAPQTRSRDRYDQGGKPDHLKKPLGYHTILKDAIAFHRENIEPGGFVKLRELAIGYTLPETWTSRWLGGALDRVTISAVGRNLLTFTRYSGLDPEVGTDQSFVGSATIDRFDGYVYPNSRSFSLALELVF